MRKTLEYFHADRLNYAVVGTPNRLEYDQGFFVKNGDGAADVKPIAHLYKTQVYAMARHLGLPEEICSGAADHRHLQPAAGPGRVLLRAAVRPQMDIALWALNHGVPPASSAARARHRRSDRRAVRLPDIDAEARAPRATCTRARCWSSRFRGGAVAPQAEERAPAALSTTGAEAVHSTRSPSLLRPGMASPKRDWASSGNPRVRDSGR